MKEKTTQSLRKRLIKRRDEILRQVAKTASDRVGLEERAIERLDEAQREDLTRILDKLDQRGREEIEEIDLALGRMGAGTYGVCELCRKSITIKRLEIMPATRLCRTCAQKYEKAQKARHRLRDEVIDEDLLDAYRDAADEKTPLKPGKRTHNGSISDNEKW